MSEEKLKILCVDDELRVLHGLQRHLAERFEFFSATSGALGLECLSQHKDIAIVVSDMRMPEMDGAAFLQNARRLRPNAVRVLLTGHADIQAAIKSVNQGQIFRFLTKPCPPDDLIVVMEEAQRQYELIVAEKTLLNRTLLGCIKALVDTLSFTNPDAMGRAVRLKRRVSAIGKEIGLERRWQVEAAAMFSGLGSFALAPAIVQKIADADPLDDLERAEVLDATKAANRLISQIPRLESVSRLLDFALGVDPGEPMDAVGKEHLELLRLGIEFDGLEERGMSAEEALAALRTHNKYSAKLLEATSRTLAATRESSQRVTLPLAALRAGMIIDEDIHTQQGVLIAPRGCEVTPSFLLHIHKFEGRLCRDKVKVQQTASATPTAAPCES
ncbi:MAG: response regulator [Steroidobacteraceae bacterium]